MVASSLLIAFSTPARADDVHYQDYPVGNRATGLGGAFGAIANDPSGIFYNPAGIVDVNRNNVSVSTSLYGLTSNSPNGLTSADFARLALNVIPSEVGATTVIGDFSPLNPPKACWGFDVVVPSSVSQINQQTATTAISPNDTRALSDQTLSAGAGIAYRLNARWSIGLSVFYRHREVSYSDEDYSGASATPGAFNDVATSLSAYDDSALAKVGGLFHITPEISAGLTLETPSVYIRSGGQARVTDASWSGTGAPQFNAYSADTDVSTNDLKMLTQTNGAFRVAGAYVSPKFITATLDVMGYMPANYQRMSFANPQLEAAIPLPVSISTEYTMNVAAGVEWLIIHGWSLAGGFYTDRSAAPQITTNAEGVVPNGRNTLPHVDLYGGTFAVGYYGEHSLTRIGFTGTTGSGYEAVFDSAQQAWIRQPLRQSDIYVFVASTFRY